VLDFLLLYRKNGRKCEEIVDIKNPGHFYKF